MVRYTLFVTMILGSAAAAVAAIAPNNQFDTGHRTTIIYKSEDPGFVEHVRVEKCAVEDCSDTPQQGM